MNIYPIIQFDTHTHTHTHTYIYINLCFLFIVTLSQHIPHTHTGHTGFTFT